MIIWYIIKEMCQETIFTLTTCHELCHFLFYLIFLNVAYGWAWWEAKVGGSQGQELETSLA